MVNVVRDVNNVRKNLILADCPIEEINPIVGTLNYRSKPFIAKSYIANWKRTGIFSELKRYVKYFLVAFIYFFKRKKYHVIVGWQQFYTLIFCFYCSIFHVKKSNIVIALNFTYKEKSGKVSKLYKWFMRKCVNTKYLDYLHVLSSDYAKVVCQEFQFPLDRIIVTTFGIDDKYEKLSKLVCPDGFLKENYALAIGRSNRDYGFLIDAWSDIEYPLVIISDTYKGTVQNDNITLLSNVAGDEAYPWIVNCGLMVIPIDDGTICSGDTVLLTAMSLKRKIVVTTPSTLAEMYVTDEENGFLVEKDATLFRQKVMDILCSEKHKDIGENARNCFLQNFTRSMMGVKISQFLSAHNYD